MNSEWKPIAGKPAPQSKHTVLCGWKGNTYGHSQFDVLTHWPDGVWTDNEECVIDGDEMPTHWMDISPLEVASDTTNTGPRHGQFCNCNACESYRA